MTLGMLDRGGQKALPIIGDNVFRVNKIEGAVVVEEDKYIVPRPPVSHQFLCRTTVHVNWEPYRMPGKWEGLLYITYLTKDSSFMCLRKAYLDLDVLIHSSAQHFSTCVNKSMRDPN